MLLIVEALVVGFPHVRDYRIARGDG